MNAIKCHRDYTVFLPFQSLCFRLILEDLLQRCPDSLGRLRSVDSGPNLHQAYRERNSRGWK